MKLLGRFWALRDSSLDIGDGCAGSIFLGLANISEIVWGQRNVIGLLCARLFMGKDSLAILNATTRVQSVRADIGMQTATCLHGSPSTSNILQGV